MTTQCEVYEVIKLREVPQRHALTDLGGMEQAAYAEVGERLRVVSQQDAAGAGASGPQQEATTQQMYEEVATLHDH